jgi:hypothetical protein
MGEKTEIHAWVISSLPSPATLQSSLLSSSLGCIKLYCFLFLFQNLLGSMASRLDLDSRQWAWNKKVHHWVPPRGLTAKNKTKISPAFNIIHLWAWSWTLTERCIHSFIHQMFTEPGIVLGRLLDGQNMLNSCLLLELALSWRRQALNNHKIHM